MSRMPQVTNPAEVAPVRADKKKRKLSEAAVEVQRRLLRCVRMLFESLMHDVELLHPHQHPSVSVGSWTGGGCRGCDRREAEEKQEKGEGGLNSGWVCGNVLVQLNCRQSFKHHARLFGHMIKC